MSSLSSLTLSPLFTETICRLYLEKHHPDEIAFDEDHDIGDLELKNKVLSRNWSLYELFNLQEGFLVLQSYFIKATFLLDRDNADGYGGMRANYSAYSIEVDEYRFCQLIQDVVDNVDSLTSQEIYELLDGGAMESIGFREFCSFVMIIAAKEAGQLL